MFHKINNNSLEKRCKMNDLLSIASKYPLSLTLLPSCFRFLYVNREYFTLGQKREGTPAIANVRLVRWCNFYFPSLDFFSWLRCSIETLKRSPTSFCSTIWKMTMLIWNAIRRLDSFSGIVVVYVKDFDDDENEED